AAVAKRIECWLARLKDRNVPAVHIAPIGPQDRPAEIRVYHETKTATRELKRHEPPPHPKRRALEAPDGKASSATVLVPLTRAMSLRAAADHCDAAGNQIIQVYGQPSMGQVRPFRTVKHASR